ncbi:Sjogrens syndrome scleroderma autoantigen 1 protein [Halorhabdus tiamatea SARL4B]|uniref:Sjogrens syndrome scleroderma autoantigen 1 protein n=1 Tax=Halorhabdus tiamatea SARL4B TaxID=1033806 RepID=F7PQ74_9EURY|nr:Sjogren's syndrome/scleroderma autoantigen 1 family protein [Halorhabdus tiamatea]ERJ05046.1 Sjogrens syndrome scleroderma autoantigen 1 protein [Halorhabdus tiamatea SARL4B]CCQ33086.1 conserved hypothetical protein [Halorhabdus tiamatea SARL4B]
MSDFDEEAERERLREQFEKDRKKREATEQMSELLLQGATMTDAHCETCGDPIFRYDGQEFCPTCQGAGGEDAGGETPEADETPTSEASSADATTEPDSETTAESSAQTVASPDTPATAPTKQTEREASPRSESPSPEVQREQRVDVPALDPDQQQSTARGTGDLQDARESLVATLSSFARQAEATDDPRRASDALEAAREAAETLAALDRLR